MTREPVTMMSPVADQDFRLDVEAAIDSWLAESVGALDSLAPLLAGMVRYHLGWLDEELTPLTSGVVDRGKRIRPSVALLTCAAAGGDPETAAPLAAAIELLHNFTLIHDDIQDASPTRRHRPTVWKLWGTGQAINAGDALFAVAQRMLLRQTEVGIAPVTVIRLAEAFNRTTMEIVAGQVLDLGFEGRDDVTAADYREMIDGKTAAIVRFAAWAGALVGGAPDDVADAYGAFGRALGLGFQVRDDFLGIWGSPAATGKAAADDIRRRKQSLPILLLRERADADVKHELEKLYAAQEIDAAGTERILHLLATLEIRGAIEAEVERFHVQARDALLSATGHCENAAGRALLALVDSLATRSG